MGAGPNRTGQAGLWETYLKIQRSSSLFRDEIRYEAVNKLVHVEKMELLSACKMISIVVLIEVASVYVRARVSEIKHVVHPLEKVAPLKHQKKLYTRKAPRLTAQV